MIIVLIIIDYYDYDYCQKPGFSQDWNYEQTINILFNKFKVQ